MVSIPPTPLRVTAASSAGNQRVTAHTAVQHIAAVTTAVDDIITSTAVDGIITSTACKRIGAIITSQIIIPATTNGILNAYKHVFISMGVVYLSRANIYGYLTSSVCVTDRIRTISTVKSVVAFSTGEGVVTGITVQGVSTFSTGEGVVTGSAMENVIAISITSRLICIISSSIICYVLYPP